VKFLNNDWTTRVYRDEEGGEPDGTPGGGTPDPDGGTPDPDGGSPDPGNDGGDGGDPDPDGGAGGAGGDPTPTWLQSSPEDWRQQIAGDDEKKLKRLERFTDINHYLSNTFDEHDRLRQGELSGARPEGDDETALNEWREANGIPVDGTYNMQFSDGVEVMDEDRRIIDAVMPIAHAADVSEATLNALAEGMLKARATEVDNLIAQDGLDAQQREQMLRDQWKGDYDVNMQAVENLLTRELPEDLQKVFRQARGADGKGLFNNPAVVAMFAKLERTINPMSTIPGGGNNDVATARQIVDEAKGLLRKGNSGDTEAMKAYDDPAFQKKYDAAIEYLQSQGEKI
jgi:hypothetical protein